MTWGNVKRGDTVLEVYAGGRTRRLANVTVKSVGRRWITTEHGRRYDAKTGGGEYGHYLTTAEALADQDARATALATMRECMDYGARGAIPTDALVRAAAILRGDA